MKVSPGFGASSGFKYRLRHISWAAGSFATFFSALSLSFVIYKMGIFILIHSSILSFKADAKHKAHDIGT